jgi:uncharacterized repeat protein (TIGR01451 family)
LGGADLRADGGSALRLVVASAPAGGQLVIEVFTDATSASRAGRVLPAIGASTEVVIGFGELVQSPGAAAPADLSDVGAIRLTLLGTDQSVSLEAFETLATAVTATKTDALAVDLDVPDQVDPGDTLEYTIAITSQGEAGGAGLTDTLDPNLTLVEGSVDATPLARNDGYSSAGGVGLSVVAPGLLGNDGDPDGGPVSVDTGSSQTASARGGTVSYPGSDGSFVYAPAPGAVGVDAFTYTIEDASGNTDTGTVTVFLDGLVWFVDDAACAAPCGSGTLANPFGDFSALNGAGGAGDVDGPGDMIYVRTGSGSTDTGGAGGFELEDGQRLVGEGVDLVLNGQTLVTGSPGSRPTLVNADGPGVVLARDNTLRGLDLGDANGFALAGPGVGGLTVAEVAVANGSGGGVSLADGTVSVSLDGVASTGSATQGIDLGSLMGSFTVTGTTAIDASAGTALRVQDSAGAAFAFGTTAIGGTTSAAAGVDVAVGNAGASFGFASLDVTTSSGAGLVAGASTLALGGTANTIAATGGPGVSLTQSTMGDGSGGAMTFASVSSTNSTGAGIFVSGATGSFTASGGSVSGPSGIGVDVDAGTAAISYAGSVSKSSSGRLVRVQNRGTGAGAVTLSGNLGCSSSCTGVQVSNNSAGSVSFSGTSKTLSTGASQAVTLTSNTGSSVSFTGGGLVITTTSGTGFNATGGGTLSVTGTGNSVATTLGVGVQVANTTIGPNNLEFRSISAGTGASGPANGIVLNDTGSSGGLKVNGTGSAGSGGTIQRTGGVGVLLTSTQHVSLNSMNVQNSGDDGIRGQGIHNFELIGSNLTNNGNATAENGLQFGEATGALAGITGILTITNTNITGSAGNNVHIRNTSGTLAAMNIIGGSFNDLNDTTGANSFLFEMSGTATTTAATVAGAAFSNNSPQRGLEVQAHESGTISSFTVSGSSFDDNGIHASFTQDTTANLTFSMLGNDMQAASPLHAINVFSSATSTGGSITGTIGSNVIGNPTVASSGAQGNGIRVLIQGRTTAVLRIHDNTLRQIWDPGNGARGIDIQFLGPTAGGQPITQSDVTITNNDVDTMAPGSSFPLAAIYLAADDQGSPARVRADITGNTAVNSVGGGSFDYPTFDGNGAHLVFVEVGGAAEGQLVDVPPTSTDATAQLTSANTGMVFTQGITLIAGPVSTP